MRFNCTCTAQQQLKCKYRPAYAYCRLSRPHRPHVIANSSLKISPLESSESPFCSQDPVQRQAAIDFYTQAYRLQRSKQQHSLHEPLIHIPSSDIKHVAKCCPLLATALLLPAGALLFAPQQALQLLAGTVSNATTAPDPLWCCFARLMGLGYLFQALVTSMVCGCVGRDELGGTTCQRMLMATLLPIPGVMLNLNKAAACCSAVGITSLGVLEVGMFGVHVLLHLHHHPWFFLKVFWPLAVTMLITEMMPTNWAFAGAGAGAFQAILTALLSVKLFGRLSRVTASLAPALAKQWLLPTVAWLSKHALPGLTARLANVLPTVARHTARLVPRLTRYGTKLAGRMAPRYAQDQLAGRTQQWAFPEADGLLTDTVAKCVDLMPPKNAASWAYAGLLLAQLMMVLHAYAPDLIFSAALSPATAVVAAGTAASAANAAASFGSSAAVLGFARFSWGAAFFVSAFACNCLKTAADRGHLWKLANRHLNMAMALLQAGTAFTMLVGIEAGAVASKTFTWLQIATAAAGTLFCTTQAIAAGLQQQQVLGLVAAAVGSRTPNGSTVGSAMSSLHLQHTEQQGGQCGDAECSLTSNISDSNEKTASRHQFLVQEGLDQQAIYLFTAQPGQQQVSNMPGSLLSSVECETRERGDPHYPAVKSATCNLLTLVQLAL